MTIYQKFKTVAGKYEKSRIVKWKKNGRWLEKKYGDFLKLVDQTADGLERLGLEMGDRTAILSENRWEWLAVDLALNKIGAISVPIHAASNRDTIEYILKDSEAGVLVISESLLAKHEDFFKSYKDLDEVIVLADNSSELTADYTLFSDLLNSDSVSSESKGNDDSLASIIYTSGTTGEPKGVMLSNNNFLFNVQAVGERVPIFADDIFLSFLPLSHVLERTAGSYTPILNGACVAYAENIKKVVDNLGEIRPTVLISIPKIFEKMYEKIFSAVRLKGRLARKIFYWSLQQRPGSRRKKIAEFLVLKKLRHAVFGGRLRLSVSGGASINEKIIKFFINIGIQVIEGYGMTETSPIIAVNSLAKNKIGSVGAPLSGVEVKIAFDKEILVKGENVMLGYWNKPEATQETFTEDSWFKTGDLGFLDQEDFLTIIGRKKDLIVTSNGKNIAPEKLEGIINLSPLIEQSVVVGHRRSFLAVLIVPDKESIKQSAGEISPAEIEKLITEEITKINAKLESHEQIRKIKILANSFSVEEGELTPTLKVRRKIIENKYSRLIDEFYN